jgi:hypothetical protein
VRTIHNQRRTGTGKEIVVLIGAGGELIDRARSPLAFLIRHWRRFVADQLDPSGAGQVVSVARRKARHA